MEGVLKYHDDYQSGKISMKEIARRNKISSSRVTEMFNIKLDNIINNYSQPYTPIEPKIVKTEEENAKKHFNVGDWQTMTDEQKQPYL